MLRTFRSLAGSCLDLKMPRKGRQMICREEDQVFRSPECPGFITHSHDALHATAGIISHFLCVIKRAGERPRTLAIAPRQKTLYPSRILPRIRPPEYACICIAHAAGFITQSWDVLTATAGTISHFLCVIKRARGACCRSRKRLFAWSSVFF
jgi:hypothetical protein